MLGAIYHVSHVLDTHSYLPKISIVTHICMDQTCCETRSLGFKIEIEVENWEFSLLWEEDAILVCNLSVFQRWRHYAQWWWRC